MELRDVSDTIRKVMSKESLDAEEAKEAFLTIMEQDRQGFFYLAFFTALTTKGETAEELLGLCQATAELCPKITTELPIERVIDVSGTGGATRKTINVSTASTVIGAAAGLYVPKQAARRITSPTGSADLYEAFGIKPYELQPEQIVETLQEIGTCPLYYPAFAPALHAARIGLSGKIFREAGLKIRTPLHLFAFAFHPIAEVQQRIYGVMDGKYREVLADLFLQAGYRNGMVVHGDGFAEITVTGETAITAFSDGKRTNYCVTPEAFDITRRAYEEVKAVSAEQNIEDFLRILYNREHGPKADMVFLNAGALLYVTKTKPTILEGMNYARELVQEGAAREKLEMLVAKIGDTERLRYWKERAGV